MGMKYKYYTFMGILDLEICDSVLKWAQAQISSVRNVYSSIIPHFGQTPRI